MAEAAVGSIISLIDLSTKVLPQLQDFNSKGPEASNSFRSLATRLPLLTVSLQQIARQTKAGRLSADVTTALQSVAQNTHEQLSIIHNLLSTVVLPENASRRKRALRALRNLAKEKATSVVNKIHDNIDFLLLHQTSQHIDAGDHIHEQLSKLTLAPIKSSIDSRGHHYPNVTAQGYAQLHLGDVHFHGVGHEQHRGHDGIKPYGMCMGQAPQIEPDAFKGRRDELQQLQDMLLPANHRHRQCIVSIVGMGGIGKTQLSLAFVREYADEYTSVFWVNAKDETSLRQDLAALSTIIFPDFTSQTIQSVDDDKMAIERTRFWLSEPQNDRWLLIFDNYDDPRLPGIPSASGYDIRPFFPVRAQGSILITTRSTKLAFSRQLHLQKLHDVFTGVEILSQRSRQDLSHDREAFDLVKRLEGLPLALATAGSYLASTGVSCREYLEMYETAWMDLVGVDDAELFEYDNRTLSSTWVISVNHVRSQNEDAVELLRFLAFLSPHDFWYELIEAGASDEVPWLRRITQSKISFQRAICKLRDYSLVDVVAGSYQIHPCLHDWLVASLQTPPDKTLFVAAVLCIVHSIREESSLQYWAESRRLLEHIEQVESPRLRESWQVYASDERVSGAANDIARLESNFDRYTQAEQMCQWALAGKESALGPEHTSTLDTVSNLGLVYREQGKLDEAEKMYMRALAGYEKALGPEDTSTLGTVNNLGVLYRDQGKLDEAGKMYMRALAGKEKALGLEHTSTLGTVSNLGLVYREQGKLDEAEQMYMRALAGYEKALGPEHTSTLDTVNNLGVLYRDQGKLDEAEKMYMQALAKKEKALGPEHTSTLMTVDSLGVLYRDQGKLDEAEKTCMRALAGYEKALGPEHTSTLKAVHNLGVLYCDQGKLDKAEQMYMQALAGYEKALGPEHTLALTTVYNLGLLYRDQGKLDEAEKMYMRALAGKEKALGSEHTSTLDTVHISAFCIVIKAS